MFQDLSIRSKLLFMLALPVLGLIYYSCREVSAGLAALSDTAAFTAQTQSAVSISALIHETQRERGKTALFLSDPSPRRAEDLRGQRALVDQRRAALVTPAVTGDAGRGAALDEAQRLLEQLASRRAAIDNRALAVPAAIGYYTQVNAAWLGLVAGLAASAEHPALIRQLVAYVAFLRAKERAGIERATLAAAFAADRLDLPGYTRFIAASEAQSLLLSEFQAFATEPQRGALKERLEDPAVAEVQRLAARAREVGTAGALGVSPDRWFQVATTRIDRLKDIEDRLSADLSALAGQLRGAALQRVAGYGGLAAALLSLTLLAAGLILRAIVGPLRRVVQAAGRVADGDLADVPGTTARDEIGQLQRAIAAMVARLRHVIGEIHCATDSLFAASAQVSTTTQTLAQGSVELATAMQSSSASLHDINHALQRSASDCAAAEARARAAAADAGAGGRLVADTVAAMGQVSGQVAVLDQLARQTNLLALNAGIEAAHAGTQGQSFAVVANAVQQLAAQSRAAAGQISALIGATATTTAEAGRMMTALVPGVQQTAQQMREVTAAAQEQSAGLDRISGSVRDAEQVSAKSAASAESLAAMAEEMDAQAESLRRLVSFFRLS